AKRRFNSALGAGQGPALWGGGDSRWGVGGAEEESAPGDWASTLVAGSTDGRDAGRGAMSCCVCVVPGPQFPSNSAKPTATSWWFEVRRVIDLAQYARESDPVPEQCVA